MKEKNETQKAQISPELVAKAKAGDQDAFSELYQQTSTILYRSIRSMVHDDDTAWDIQQETYLKAFQNLNKLDHNEAFLSWLRRISVNITATEMSKRLPTTFTDLGDEEIDEPEQPDPSIDTQPELALDRKETSRLVREILAELPEEQHLIVGMRYYEDLSIKEIADLLHLSQSTVKTQLFRGRKHVEASVRALEKQGLKLYGLSPIAFLVALMRRAEPLELTKQTAIQSVVTKAAVGTAGAAAGNATVVTAYTAKQLLSKSIGKILIGVLSVAAIGGGIWAGAKLLDRSQPAPYQPTETMNAVLLSQNTGDETPTDLTEPLVDVTVPITDPAESTEPTEPNEQGEISGTCGDDLTWSIIENYDDEGGAELIFSGSGAMYDYDENENRAPWYPYHSQIKELLWFNGTGDGQPEIPSIGSYAFCDCTALTNFGAPQAVTVIGAGALKNCTSLTFVYAGSNISTIGDHAFEGCSALTWVPLPQNLETIGDGAFAGTALGQIHIFNPDVSIGDGAIPAEVLICGRPDSAAERYAKDNGCAFERMDEIDRDNLIRILQESKELQKTDEALDPSSAYHPVVFSNGIYRMEDGNFLMKLVHIPFVTVPAAEMDQMLAQAKQTGEMTALGQTWTYTESAEEARACMGEGFFTESEYGWIVDETEKAGYAIARKNDQYVFTYSTYGIPGIVSEKTETSLGWITLSGDTAFTQWREPRGDESTLSVFVSDDISDAYEWYWWQLELDDNGQFVVNANKG